MLEFFLVGTHLVHAYVGGAAKPRASRAPPPARTMILSLVKKLEREKKKKKKERKEKFNGLSSA